MNLYLKNIDKVIFFTSCSSLILILCLNQLPILGVLIILSLILILSLLNEITVMRFSLYFMVLSWFSLDTLWLAGRNVPINIKYLIDIINIILMFKILFKNKKYNLINVFRDKILILSIIFIFVSVFKWIIFNYSLLEFFNGIRIYLRFLPFYIIIKNNNDQRLLCDLKFIIILQIPILLMQVIKYTNQDMIGGTFGIYGQTYLFILLIPVFFYILNKYLKKDISIYKMLLSAIIILSICAINETKIAFFIFPIICIIMLVLFNEKYSFYRKIFFTLMISFSIIVSFKLLINRYDGMDKLFSDKNTIINYATKNNNPLFYLGRLENFNYIKDIELNNFSNNLVGIGIGRALQDEFFAVNHFSNGRIVNQIPLSEKYLELQHYGYFLSSLNTFYFENGIVGILIYLFILFILFKRCVFNIKIIKNINITSLSYAFSALIISWIPLFYYNDIFYQYQTSTIFWILAALISKYYYDVKLD
ncbi:hypothetical protein FDC66_12580 [Clostridium botulinum]|nr:hypothetical protein [Clostridium botulinum]